jgi:Zn-dependent protease
MWSDCSKQFAASPSEWRDSILSLAGIDFTVVLIQITVLIASLSVHEAAHAWAADRLGDPTARKLGRLSLNPAVHVDPIGTLLFPLIAMLTRLPLIGWAKPVPVDQRYLRHPKRDFALIAAAGPASNIVMAIIGALVFALVPSPEPGDIVGRVVTTTPREIALWFTYLNVLLAVFNMIPVPPLDGGNVLLGVLPQAGVHAVERLRPYGFLILYALMLTGVLSYLVGPVATVIVRLLLRVP